MAFGGVWGSAGERLLLMAGMLSWRACTPGVGGGGLGGPRKGAQGWLVVLVPAGRRRFRGGRPV